MKGSPLNEAHLWFGRCAVEANPDAVTYRQHLEV
jgi:hypothetical protein